MCPVWIWKPTVSLTEKKTISLLIFYCIIVAVSTDLLSSFCLWPFCLSYVTFSRPCCLCDVYSSQSLKNVVTKAVRPCPCDWCVFEKRCFFGKKKLVKSSVSTNLFAVKQKCINVQRNIMDQCLQLTQSVHSCSFVSLWGEV